MRISRRGGTYTCFVCNREHTHEAPRPAWLPAGPLLEFAPAALSGQSAEKAEEDSEEEGSKAGAGEQPSAKRARRTPAVATEEAQQAQQQQQQQQQHGDGEAFTPE